MCVVSHTNDICLCVHVVKYFVKQVDKFFKSNIREVNLNLDSHTKGKSYVYLDRKMKTGRVSYITGFVSSFNYL